MKPQIMANGFSKFGKDLEKVKRINCDMNPTMEKICTNNFVNAQIIIDKFHVIKHVLDVLKL